MQRSLLFSLLIVPLLYGGCKNDLPILDNYEEKIVCFALLNPYDTVQYIRIGKAFLGEASALAMAQQPDSIGFPPGRLQVTIERWLSGTQLQVFTLTEDSTVPRDEGIFHWPYMICYRGNFPVLKDGSSYLLRVLDRETGTTVSSETKVVQDIAMVDPANSQVPLNLAGTNNINFRFRTGTNGLRYHFRLRCHYTEQFIADTTQTAEKFFDWDIGEAKALDDSGGELMTFGFVRNSFLAVMAARIPVNTDVRRISGKIDLVFTGAAQETDTYLEVQSAILSSSTASIEPYSNIEGGYGLFSCRTTTCVPDFMLDANTRNALCNEPVTQPLNFIR